MAKAKAYPARVIWHDAASSQGWFPESVAVLHRPYVVESYGWVIRADKEVVVITTSRHDSEAGLKYGDTLDIPRAMVQSIRRVK